MINYGRYILIPEIISTRLLLSWWRRGWGSDLYPKFNMSYSYCGRYTDNIFIINTCNNPSGVGEMKQPKLKYTVDFEDLKKTYKIPFLSGTFNFKKGDMVDLIDEKTGISKRCEIKGIGDLKDNPHNKGDIFSSLFRFIVIET